MGIFLFYVAAWEVQNYRLDGSMGHWNLILCLLHTVLSIDNSTVLSVLFFFFLIALFRIVSEYVLEVHKLT